MFPNLFWDLIEGPLTSQPKFSSRQFFARPRPSPNLFIFRIRATLMLVFLPIEYFGGFSFWNFYTSHGTLGGKCRDWGGKQGWWTLEPPIATLLRDAPTIPSPVLTLCPIRFGGLSFTLTSYRWLLWQVHSAVQCIAQHCTAFNPNPFSKANCTPSRSHFKTFFAPFPFTKLLPFAPNTHHSILLFEPFPTNITSKGSVEVAIAWCTACLDFHFRTSPPFSPNLPLPSATTLHPHIAKSWEVSNLFDKLKVRW